MAAEPTEGARDRRRDRSPLAILFLTVFLDLVGFGIVIPLLPLYAEEFGAGPVAVTALVAVFSLMQFFFAPWWGQLSDRIGRRPVLIVGLFGSALSYLLFGLAGSLAVLFASRALAGFMGANVGVAQAYIADVTEPGERARGMGLIGAAFGLGFIFGPAIGGLLAPLGASAPFYGAAALSFLNGVAAIYRLPESLPEETRARASRQRPKPFARQLEALRQVLSGARIGRLYLMILVITFALAGMEATFSLFVDRRWGLGPSGIAYLFVYIGVVAALVQGALVGRITRVIGEARAAVVGALALAIGFLAIPLSSSLAFLGIALAAFALGRGLVMPPLSSLISLQVGPDEQGRVLGASQSLSALGRVLGPLFAGLLFAHLGSGAPYFSGALLVTGALLVMLPLLSRGPVR